MSKYRMQLGVLLYSGQPNRTRYGWVLHVPDARRGKAGCIRLYRDVLQSQAQACEDWDAVASRVRAVAEDET